MTLDTKRDFDDIVQSCDRRLFNLMLKLSNNYHTAQDLSQEVLLIAFREYPKFRGESDVFTWIYRIAINHFRRHARRARYKSWLGLEDVGEDELAVEPDDTAELGQREHLVREAVAGLPLEFRETVVLFYFDGQACEQIAELLNCSEGTVKSRLWRGRQMLAKKLKGFIAETGV